MVDVLAETQGDPDLKSVDFTVTASSPPSHSSGGSIVITASTETGCLLGATGETTSVYLDQD